MNSIDGLADTTADGEAVERASLTTQTVVPLHAAGRAEPYFFSVSIMKYLVMMVVTLTFYQVWLFYKHWLAIKLRDKSDIQPAARALFSVFYIYPLFKRISADSVALGESRVYAGPLAALWIVASLTYRLPSPWEWIVYIATFTVIPAQIAANRVNQLVAPDHDRNSRFTPWNIVGIVIGSIFWLLALAGLLLPDEEASSPSSTAAPHGHSTL